MKCGNENEGQESIFGWHTLIEKKWERELLVYPNSNSCSIIKVRIDAFNEMPSTDYLEEFPFDSKKPEIIENFINIKI